MKLYRTALMCLGFAPFFGGCQDVGEKDAGPTVEESSAELTILNPTPPPLVNLTHADLSSMLNAYTGYPALGAKAPGMIAAVVKGKHIVALGASGYAKIPGNIPMTEDMVFNIGSNTKSMTALLLSILIEEHPSLSWSTTLGQALPWATEPGKEYIRPAARKNVTLEQLVSHRSGIACAYEKDGVDVNNQVFSHPDYTGNWKSTTRQQVVKDYLRGPAIAIGGNPTGFLADCIDVIGNYDYENGNFSIAQAVIDHWSGMSFVDYARQKLINPHGLDATFLPSHAFFLAQPGSIDGTALQKAYWNPYFFDPTHPYLAAGKYVWGHSAAGAPVAVNDPDVDPWGMSPGAGGFAFNIQDWARYAIVHLRDTSAAVTRTHETPFSEYNFGWSTGPRTTTGGVEYSSLCHSGSLSGMQSKICLYPDLDIAYLSFANGGPDPDGANEAAVTWMANNASYRRNTGGCKDDPALLKGVQRFWDSEMFGCAGTVTFSERASMCATGYHVCGAQEYVTNNLYGSVNAEAPKHHYWTDDQLGYGGSSSGSCWAAPTGSSCGADTPMRVCASGGADPEGNDCNWTGCGFGADSTTNRYFGGCIGDTTAGALCCKN
jgi:CubicO group peptidase (beta-lactamase class C family)